MRKTVKTVRVEREDGKNINLKLMTYESVLGGKRAVWTRHGKQVGVNFRKNGMVFVSGGLRGTRCTTYYPSK